MIDSALTEARCTIHSIDKIAVTEGPGLAGALLVGMQTAKALAFCQQKPLVRVDHLIGHLFAPYLSVPNQAQPPLELPFVSLLVSGGHTALYWVQGFTKVTLLGETRDDAAGEAYDKVAKLLGLAYPGGPPIDALAQKGDPRAIRFPRPMLHSPRLDFSFSGLKTAVVVHLRKAGLPQTEEALADLCASFQAAVIDSLLGKAFLACKHMNASRLVITGGVSANRGLRENAAERCAARNLELILPELAFCTDNAAMIAYVGANITH